MRTLSLIVRQSAALTRSRNDLPARRSMICGTKADWTSAEPWLPPGRAFSSPENRSKTIDGWIENLKTDPPRNLNYGIGVCGSAVY